MPDLEELLQTLETTLSPAEKLARLPADERHRLLDQLSPAERRDLTESWAFWARPNQVQPGPDCECCRGEWLNWLIMAGRGWGKTRTGAEWVHEQAASGIYRRFYIVGATLEDAAAIQVKGESGLLATAKSSNPVKWSPTNLSLTWANGAVGQVFSGESPERFRGHQGDAAWADELASWTYEESWSQMQLGLRLGPKPRTIITTTPRPKPLIRRLVKAPTTHVTYGTTYENLSNLADAFIAEITATFEGTRFGRQEIYAQLLDDNEFALWTRDILEEGRRKKSEAPRPDECKRVVIGVDPAISLSKESDETGIIVAGLGRDDHGYLYHDASGRYKPEQWAARVAELYRNYGASLVVAEKQQGGDMVEHTIKTADPDIRVKLVSASKSKVTRAEPVALAYERGKIHHVGEFATLEEQMCTWEQGDPESPDRLDAAVWAFTELVVGRRVAAINRLVDNELGTDNPWWRQT